MSETAQADEAREKVPRKPSRLEWLVSGVGVMLVALSLGFLLFEAFVGGDRPPTVQLQVLRVTASSGGYLVNIEARNTGDETAAELAVEGTIARGGQTVETSETIFAYLPPDSVREGGLYFSQDPRGALSLRVVGYREP